MRNQLSGAHDSAAAASRRCLDFCTRNARSDRCASFKMHRISSEDAVSRDFFSSLTKPLLVNEKSE